MGLSLSQPSDSIMAVFMSYKKKSGSHTMLIPLFEALRLPLQQNEQW